MSSKMLDPSSGSGRFLKGFGRVLLRVAVTPLPFSAVKIGIYAFTAMVGFTAVWVSTVWTVFWHLAKMRGMELAPVGGWVMAILIAFTSLMYNRARAYKEDAPQHSASLEAAELGMSAAMFAVFSGSVAAASMYWLMTLGYSAKPAPRILSGTGVAAVVPTVLLFVAFLRLTEALTVLFASSVRHKLPVSQPGRPERRRVRVIRKKRGG